MGAPFFLAAFDDPCTPRPPRAGPYPFADRAARGNAPRLGELLVRQGVISPSQLAFALERQRRTGRPLGEELVRAGFAPRRQVTLALELQRMLRIAAFGSAIALACARPLPAHGAATGEIGVHCVVPPRAELQVEYQKPDIAISAGDIARGYVDVPSGSLLSVTTNSRAGYVVEFHKRLPIFKSVKVRTSAASGEIGPDGGTIVERGRGGRAVRSAIAYRFVLADGIEPGTYAWPLAIEVRPL